MLSDHNTGALSPAHDAEALLNTVPELKSRIDLTLIQLFNIDSSNMAPSHWSKIAETIAEHYDDFDGFVVTQGTDTMAYSAAATSFVLQNLGKPVVFTGSLIPMSELGADGRNNLIYACLVASLNLGEVAIVFGNKILRGNRTVKNHESFVDVFHSPCFPLLGEIERPIHLDEWRKRRHDNPISVHPGFNSNIQLITLFPGLAPKVIDSVIDSGAQAIIIQGFGPGNVPFLDNSIIPQIKRATSQKIPVIITSQMEKSVTNLHAYEAGYKALEAGAIGAVDMTLSAAVSKTMWTLAQTDIYSDRLMKLTANIAGELSVD